MSSIELSWRGPRRRRLAARFVLLSGWAALAATTSPNYRWTVSSDSVDVDFDVPQSSEAERHLRVRVEGHPQLLDAPLFLTIEEPGRDLLAVDAGNLDLPEVFAPGLLTPTPSSTFDHDVAPRLRYPIVEGCETLPCEVDVTIRVKTTTTPYRRPFTFTAEVEGRDANEAPPGRVTLVDAGTP